MNNTTGNFISGSLGSGMNTGFNNFNHIDQGNLGKTEFNIIKNDVDIYQGMKLGGQTFIKSNDYLENLNRKLNTNILGGGDFNSYLTEEKNYLKKSMQSNNTLRNSLMTSIDFK